jgi:hypothetical protein
MFGRSWFAGLARHADGTKHAVERIEKEIDMKILAIALILAGATFAFPSHASSDAASDRQQARTAQPSRAAGAPARIARPAPAPGMDRAAACSCPRLGSEPPPSARTR